MRTRLVFSLGLLLSATLSWGGDSLPEDFKRECESRVSPTEVVVTVAPNAIEYDFTRSLAQLQHLRNNNNTRPSKWLSLGFTKQSVSSAITWEQNGLKIPDSDNGCMRPKISVQLNGTGQTIYIASEFKEGSCAFSGILRHELRHAKVNQEGIKAVAQRIESQMRDFFGNTVYYGPLPLLETQMNEALEKSWMPLILQELRDLDKEHKKIDTPEEERFTQAMCSGEVTKVLRNAGF